MIHIVRLQNRPPQPVQELANELLESNYTGALYIGYPNPSRDAEQAVIDAVLVCEELGVLVFDSHVDPAGLNDPAYAAEMEARLDDLYIAIENKLRTHSHLRHQKRLAVPLHAVVYLPFVPANAELGGASLVQRGRLSDTLDSLPRMDADYFRPLVEALQNVAAVRPKSKRTEVRRTGSRGAVLREIEAHLANMDQWQTQAAMETPDGGQRVRGLAGSGKTIVLALKVAILHRLNPEWKIAVTFYTRSLYQHFERLISRFYYDLTGGEEPDFTDAIHLRHCWGSSYTPGIYSDLASEMGVDVFTYEAAKERFRSIQPFSEICAHLLAQIKEHTERPAYDILLIDEAQDLPVPFFQLAAWTVKPPKRIVIAYDELQHLGDVTMPPPTQLFGSDADGRPRVTIRSDIILPICYRNTEWALSAAHALGFGVYRAGGLIQMFDDSGMWQNIGYSRVSGEFAPEKWVAIHRSEEASPVYFHRLMREEDAITCNVFETAADQASWVAESVAANIQHDELRRSDILIVLPDPVTFRKEAGLVVDALAKAGIAAHLVGINSSRDEVFLENSVAIAHVHRAKGNEAPMVYVLNADYGYTGLELIKRRNSIFTAITRSRAWVRISGVGAGMRGISDEIESLRQRGYRLEFRVPTAAELRNMRSIGRDRGEAEVVQFRAFEDSLQSVLERLEKGELDWSHFRPDVIDRLKKALPGD